MNKKIKIYTIVVIYNGEKWIKKCFSSLKDSDFKSRVIAIDNNSSDNSVELIKENFPEIHIVKNKKNLGFGKANNVGIKKAIDENADYVFLLNQDAWIEPDTIQELIKIQQENPQYGILSPMHLAGNGINIDNLFSNYITQSKCNGLVSDLYLRPGNIKDVYQVKFVNAAFWLISRKCLLTVGGFDPLFHMYGEDDDYISRAKFHNFKIGICPSLRGFHDRNQDLHGTKRLSLKDKYYLELLVSIKLGPFIICNPKEMRNHRTLLLYMSSRFIFRTTK